MKIFLSVGHSILKDGKCTSASGYVNEYNYNKELAPYVKKYLEKAGHKVDLIICPERVFKTKKEEETYKVPRANKGGYDLVVELHLNASNGSGKGSEVFFYKGDNKGKTIALNIVKNLVSVGFTDRGVKNAQLYMINNTKPTAVLIESFFCDNKNDCDLAKRIGFDEIGRLIAQGIQGSTISKSGTSKPVGEVKSKPKIVIYKGQGDKAGAELIAFKLGCKMIPDDGTIHTPEFGADNYEVVYVGGGKDRWDSFISAAKKFNLI